MAYVESDSDESLGDLNEPIAEDPIADQFEDALLNWKKRNLIGVTDTTQDTGILENYTRRCRALYTVLVAILQAQPVTTGNADAEEFLPWIQNSAVRNPATRFAMEHILQRDLLVMPYVLNKEHTVTVNANTRRRA